VIQLLKEGLDRPVKPGDDSSMCGDS